MEALDQVPAGVDGLDRRTRLAGLALFVGGLMFFAFWINSVLDSPRSFNTPWPLQLAFHGVMLLLLIAGFASVASSLPLSGWQRISWRVGAGLIMVGVVANFGLFVAGLIVVGAVEVLAGRHRSVGTAMILGSSSWLAVWSRGARFDSEDSLPLDVLERLLSTAGLVLICIGILALAISQLRTPRDESGNQFAL